MATRRERVVLELNDSYTPEMMKAVAATRLLNAELNSLSRQSVQTSRGTVAIQRDLDRTATSARGADRSINQLTGRLRLLADIAAILGPSLVPIGAVGIPALTGLANQFGVAAFAAGGAIIAFQGVGDALKAVNDFALEPTQANLEKARAAMDQLPASARQFVAAVQAARPAFDDLQRVAADGLFPGVIESLDVIQRRMPEFKGVIREVTSAFGNLAAEGAASLAGSEWDQFFEFLQTTSRDTLSDLGRSIGNLARGMAELWVAFDPINRDFSNWMLRVSRDFVAWSDGLSQTQGWVEFVSYLRTNGPQVAETMGALGNALLQIVQAAAPLGGPVLQGLETIADVVSAIADSDLGTPFLMGMAALSAYNRLLAVTASLQGKIAAGGSLGFVGGLGRGGPSIRQDIASWSDSMVAFGANTEKAAQATERLRSRMAAAGRISAGVAGIAVASTDLGDSLGLANTASLGLMGAMAGLPGAIGGAALGAVMDMAAANDDMEAAIKRADLAMSQATGAREMAAGIAAAQREFDDLQAKLDPQNATFWGLLTDPGAALGATKNWFEGLFGESDIEEQRAELNRLKNDLFDMERNATALAVALGAASQTTTTDNWVAEWIGEGPEQITQTTISVEVMEAALRAASTAMDSLGIKKPFKDLSTEELARVAREIERLDSDAGRLENVSDSLKMLDAQLLSTADSAAMFGDALDALVTPEMDQERALLAWKDSLATLNRDLAENSRSLDSNTAAGRQNRGAVLDRVDALLSSMKADAQAGATAAQLSTKMRNGRKAILDAAEAAGLNRDQVAAMVRQMNLTPKNIRTMIEVAGVDTALANIARITGAISRIPLHPVISPIVRMVNVAAAVAGNRADGGTIPKDGKPYGDRYLYMLAPGEEVISNRRGQADRYRPLLKAINAAADGATVPGGVGAALTLPSLASARSQVLQEQLIKALSSASIFGRDMAKELGEVARGLKGLRAQLKQSEKQLDRAKQRRESIRDMRSALVDALRSSYRSDLGGEARNAFVAGGSSPNDILRADIAQLEALNKARATLAKKGLDGNPLSALLQERSLEDLQAMAGWSRKELGEYERLFYQRQGLLNTVPAAAGRDAYGATERAMTVGIRGLRQDNRRIERQLAAIRKNTKDGPGKTGKAVADQQRRGARRDRRNRR